MMSLFSVLAVNEALRPTMTVPLSVTSPVPAIAVRSRPMPDAPRTSPVPSVTVTSFIPELFSTTVPKLFPAPLVVRSMANAPVVKLAVPGTVSGPVWLMAPPETSMKSAASTSARTDASSSVTVTVAPARFRLPAAKLSPASVPSVNVVVAVRSASPVTTTTVVAPSPIEPPAVTSRLPAEMLPKRRSLTSSIATAPAELATSVAIVVSRSTEDAFTVRTFEVMLLAAALPSVIAPAVDVSEAAPVAPTSTTPTARPSSPLKPKSRPLVSVTLVNA